MSPYTETPAGKAIDVPAGLAYGASVPVLHSPLAPTLPLVPLPPLPVLLEQPAAASTTSTTTEEPCEALASAVMTTLAAARQRGFNAATSAAGTFEKDFTKPRSAGERR